MGAVDPIFYSVRDNVESLDVPRTCLPITSHYLIELKPDILSTSHRDEEERSLAYLAALG
jgi:hypothetical protein